MNGGLHNAKSGKKDEFYTQMVDIEKELENYSEHFKDKIVYCNCDCYEQSNFVKYFIVHFKKLGLKQLISTSYSKDGNGKVLIYNGEDNLESATKYKMSNDGSFKNKENIELLKSADIVVTNPPFSLFREYVAQLIEYKKQFLIIGNINAITYKEIFPLIKDNRIWLGFANNKAMEFKIHKSYTKWSRVDEQGNKFAKVGGICWFTNIEHNKRQEALFLNNSYRPELYPKYDNYDAIEVSKVVNIPVDYKGIMGVPITFLTKYNPEQFEILGSQRWAKSQELLDVYTGERTPPEADKKTTINGKETYDRIFIKHKK